MFVFDFVDQSKRQRILQKHFRKQQQQTTKISEHCSHERVFLF
jgi:hypothetical protein